MARLLLSLAAVAAVVPYASAAPKFSSPAAGATLKAGETIVVKWDDSGDTPKQADLLTYTLFLCAGGNKAGTFLPVRPITTQGSFAVTNAAQALIDAGAGTSTTTNAYFLKMEAVGKSGGIYTTFSDRFSYSGMTGAFDPVIVAGLKDIDGTTGPATVNALAKAGADPNNPAAAAPDGAYDVEYTMQTGLTRYAPMIPQPPTKITATNTKPLYPTSSVQIAKSHLPIPKVQTTVTQSQTFSVSSRENTAVAAAHATDDMSKFLRRWKD